MSWQEEYKRKTVSAEESVRIVESGDRVIIPLANQPRQLAQALAARGPELENVTITPSTPDFDIGSFLTGGEGAFELEIEIFLGSWARQYHDDGLVSFLPLPFSLTHKATDQRPDEAKPVDVALVTVTPPDKHGLVSFGAHPWFKRSYAMRAKKVLAEVNSTLIKPHGNCFLHVSNFDYFVEAEPPSVTRKGLLESVASLPDERRTALEDIINQVEAERLARFVRQFPTVNLDRLRTSVGLQGPSEAARAIAEYAKALTPDGASIQIGAGTPSNYLARLGVFDDKVDVGLHTEMVAPGVARLVEAGVINGSRKASHKSKAVAVSWGGSDERDLTIIDDNPMFELYEPHYLLNPWLMAQNKRQTSFNNALSVDLLGQINAESMFGGRMYNGLGGQPDAHLGALYSEGGRAITLLYSTAADGAISRIVPKLEEGEIVTVPRFFADTIITEYGVATLLGKNHRERAEALINIAHPDFRPELRKAAKGWLLVG